jgi:hypothetical protein
MKMLKTELPLRRRATITMNICTLHRATLDARASLHVQDQRLSLSTMTGLPVLLEKYSPSALSRPDRRWRQAARGLQRVEGAILRVSIRAIVYRETGTTAPMTHASSAAVSAMSPL